MPIDNQTAQLCLESFAQVVNIEPSNLRFSSSEVDNKTTVTLFAQKTDPEGATTETQLQISNADKPMHYLLIGKITSSSPYRNIEFTKVVAGSPSQLPSFIKSVILVQKVCRKNPHIVRRIGNKIGSYI